MKNNIILLLILVLIVLIGVLSYLFYDSTTNFHKQLLKNERNFRDSVLQSVVSLQKDREKLTEEIDSFQKILSDQTEDVKKQIKNIKININVPLAPPIPYHSLSDSALVARLLAN
jgi:predicted PurR-regulated permease PerM